MNIEVQMPSIGLSIAEGTIDRWLKKEGDSVVKGDLIVAILTEKVTVEIPAEVSGVLLKILCPAGTKVKVGQTIAIIETAGEKAEEVPKAAGVQYTPLSQGQAAAPHLARAERGELKVSPLALKMAEEHGLDIREVAARYPGEKIGKKEILSFLEERKGKEVQKETKAPEVSQGEEEVRPLSGAMRAMAEHMALSTRTAARVTTMAEVDMTELVKLREALKEKFKQNYGVSLTYVPFVIRAICQGVKEFPVLNASLRGEEVIFHRSVHAGIAVDTGESLLVPVIRDAAKKGIVELSREAIQLTEKARDGKLALQDIQGGTISLTNAGVYGALLATPIIHQPQSAILWMGKVMEAPVVREGQIVIRSMMYLCLSYDHRIIMGAQAVRFLQAVKKSLENPYPLLFD
jgi:2-oxoglutarate dehydrogenase complex dihydrolipoamide succinyltransferase (E2) component